MKNAKLFLFSSFLFLFISCNTDDDLSTSACDDSLPSLLVEQTFFNPNTSHGQRFNFTYNEDNRIENLQRTQWGVGIVNGEESPWESISNTTFQYENSLLIQMTDLQSGNNAWNHKFDYDDNGLIYKKTLISTTGAIYKYSLYKYDEQDRLIEIRDSTDEEITFKYYFEYEDDNIKSVIKETLWGNNNSMDKYEYSNFDTKWNFAKAIKAYPATFIWDNNFHAYSSVSLNNFQEEKYYSSTIGQDWGSPNSTHEYTYQYNDDGLPIQMNYVGWEVTFVYDECN